MKNVLASNVEQIVRDSNAHLFVIFLQTENENLFAWSGNSFSQIRDGHNESYLFSKEDAVREYFHALRTAKEETSLSFFESGRLDIVAIDLPQS